MTTTVNFYEDDYELFNDEEELRELVYSRGFFRQLKWDGTASRKEQRKKALAGATCTACGSSEQIEWDHLDPSTKVMDISHAQLVMDDDEYEAELAKCQPLCMPCHKNKWSIYWVDGHSVNIIDSGINKGKIHDKQWLGWFIK